jgi:hypothetical protein
MLDFSEFLDQVDQGIAHRAEARELHGIRRLGNVWRCNNAEATVTRDASAPQAGDVLVSFRSGPDARRMGRFKADSVDATADLIVDGIDVRQRRLP